MRSVVVLPAPFGPSRPVISPSRASKLTPSTARISPPRVLNDLRRPWIAIMRRPSRIPAVRADERRWRRELLQAGRIEGLRVRSGDELSHQLRRAAAAEHVVALS